MKRRVITILAIAAVVVGIVWILIPLWLDGSYLVAKINCGNERTIEIRSSNYFEVHQDLLYQIYIGDDPQLRVATFFASVPPDEKLKELEWTVLYNKEGNIIGLTESNRSDVVLMLFDFITGETWPSNWNTPRDQHDRIRDRMLQAVQDNNSDRVLMH